MYDQAQLMRGTLEGCILKVISLETTYGYEIAAKLQQYGFSEIKEGTLYPLLVRLEKKQMITSTFCPSPLGPSRKYYSLTLEGKQLLKEFEVCWKEIAKVVNTILEEETK
ncbi:MAG: PadR family transcriptional regulator [Oscillospiraceae bacterium]|nr:PadR family transcriptional regulator [Oscillospiraceae bacterium]